MAVTNYTIGQGYSRGEMVKEAQRLIDIGWTPQGGVSVHIENALGREVYSQAFVAIEGEHTHVECP